MKLTLRLTLMLSLVVGTWRVQADQTNLVQELSIHLAGLSQGPTVTNRNVVVTRTRDQHFNSHDVIAALGKSVGSAFSDSAKLLVITPLQGGNSAIVVRDGASSLDVSAYFIHEQSSGSVSAMETQVKTGRGTGTDYSIQRFALRDVPDSTPLDLHFDVNGVAEETTQTAPPQPARTELDAYVYGAGDSAGNLVILQGRVRVHGHTLEVVPDNNNNEPNN
ncbi:MAG TPA: hypothetical protein VHI52_16750 [Verrucomicrobiae bacterium]|nr:hypothetical protein [Verrucomicrobiae bacterium]